MQELELTLLRVSNIITEDKVPKIINPTIEIEVSSGLF